MDDVVLGHVADVGQATREVLAVERDPATARPRDSGERLEQRALAGAALADDRHQLAGLDRDRRRGEDRLVLDADLDLGRVEPQRAVIVAGEERVAVEDEPVGPDPDLGPGLESSARRQLAVQARAVARAEVGQLDAVALAHHLGVEARDVRVGQHDVVGAVAPDRQPIALEGDGLDADHRQLARRHLRLLAAEEAQRLVADPDRVPGSQRPALAVEALAVEERAVARAEVLDHEAAVSCARSARGGATHARRRSRRRCRRRGRASVRRRAASAGRHEAAMQPRLAVPRTGESEDSTGASLLARGIWCDSNGSRAGAELDIRLLPDRAARREGGYGRRIRGAAPVR